MNNLLQTLRNTYLTNPAAALNLLPELFKAADEGLIIELPCKLGDTMYSVIDKEIHKCEFWGIQKYHGTGGNIIMYLSLTPPIEHSWAWQSSKSYESLIQKSISSLGKTVFLTREAAEEKLEGEKK